MFQIGSGLREARERRGLTLAQAERDTRIRARWLRALEDERFDVLPARVYALGFLRTYARYLDLEEQRFVDELSSRLPAPVAAETILEPWPARRRAPVRARTLVALGVLAVAILVIGLIGLGGSKKHTASSSTPSRPAASAPSPRTRPRPVTTRSQPEPKAKPLLARLVLVASKGRCWLDARLGSANGAELHSGTLELGKSLLLRGRRLWIRLGAPTQLAATLNGSVVALPSTTPVNVVVTARGVRPVP